MDVYLKWPISNYFNPRTPCGVRRDFTSPDKGQHDFNPRTPCGVRPPNLIICFAVYKFQSTHPLRGATAYGGVQQTHPCNFNPRTPCGVRRGRCYEIQQHQRRFQSTHPLRGATYNSIILYQQVAISIHAPLAGCDLNKTMTSTYSLDFNPRTPCGVRLWGRTV